MSCKAKLCVCAALALASCADEAGDVGVEGEQPTPEVGRQISATLADGIQSGWRQGDVVALVQNGTTATASAQQGGVATTALSVGLDGGGDAPLYAVYPADCLAGYDGGGISVAIPDRQSPGDEGYAPEAAPLAGRTATAALSLHSVGGGIRFTLQMSGVTKVELESVDGYPLAGTVAVAWDDEGRPAVGAIANGSSSIITFNAATPAGLTPGVEHCIATLPCDVYGGYRLSFYRDGMVAHYFGVHQRVDRAAFIAPADLVESELEFDDVDAPLVEEERPELDATTRELLRQYQQNPTDANKQALMDQMGVRYDKVVARKKAKLRELEREAKTQSVVDEMQAIVDEMVENRDLRLQQQFLRLIDPRTDDDPNDAWMVLRGASASNPYIGYAPVTNAEYAAYNAGHAYADGTGDFPVVNITIAEATAYCDWLTSRDSSHRYRLPTDEEWVLGAGHMPKDVAMNAGHVESGLTAVTAYQQTTGACGGIDFWGNCWEWTSTTDADGKYVVKGGSWDADRDDCRSEKSDVVRLGTKGYANVGFRVVRTDLAE